MTKMLESIYIIIFPELFIFQNSKNAFINIIIDSQLLHVNHRKCVFPDDGEDNLNEFLSHLKNIILNNTVK